MKLLTLGPLIMLNWSELINCPTCDLNKFYESEIELTCSECATTMKKKT